MQCSHHEKQNKSNKTCIEGVPIFHGLSKEEIGEIANITTSKEMKKGEIIFLKGDLLENLYVIHKGQVKIPRISNEGKEQIIRVLGPGDFIGELSLFTQTISKSNAEVIEKASICVIEGKKLQKIIYKRPSIAIKIIQELSERMENAESLIEQLGIHDVEQRVVEIILSMADDNDQVNLSISKRDLAAHIGTSQETLSRKLSLLQKKGWIKLEGHRKIHILDKENLKDSIYNH